MSFAEEFALVVEAAGYKYEVPRQVRSDCRAKSRVFPRVQSTRLARDTGLSREALLSWLAGHRVPDPRSIDRLVQRLRLGGEWARILHRAAALDKGYRIG